MLGNGISPFFLVEPVPDTACPPADELAAFRDGRLADDRITAVGDHLDTCPTCRSALDVTLAADTLLAAVRQSSDTDVAPAPRLTDYRIVRELGRGGMGVVYEAEQVALGRLVALKVMANRLAPSADAVRRFDREARAVARLHHTHIVPVFAVGRDDGVPFYAMQLVPGSGLDRVIAAHRPPVPPSPATRADWAAVAELGRQAAAALAHAHARGVVHRDVKPSNLLLDSSGQIWVTDFGLAKTADPADDLTGTGDFLGTPRYMPPEAFERPADARGDVYALGLTVYELIAGRPAFDGDRGSVVKRVLTAAPPPLRSLRPDVPADLETVVQKAIDRDPARRYPTADALAEDFRRVAADEPVLARRAGPVERLARWARHNRGLAVALGSLVAVLVAAAAGGLLAADRFRAQAVTEAGLRKEQQELAGKEKTAREAAEATGEEVRRELAHAELSAAVRTADAPDGPDRVAAVVSRWKPAAGGWEWELTDRLARPVARVLPLAEAADHVEWTEDGGRLLAANGDRLTLLDSAGRPVWEWPLPGVNVFAGRWSPDERHIAVAAKHTVFVLDADTRAERFRRPSTAVPVRLAWHPDGEHLAFAAGPTTVEVVHWPTGRVAATLTGLERSAGGAFAFRPDGRRFVGMVVEPLDPRSPYRLQVWDTATWTPVRTFAGSAVRHSAVAWAGGGLVSGSVVGELALWNPDTGERVRAVEPTGDEVFALAAAPDGRRVAVTDARGGLRVWNPAEPHSPVRYAGGGSKWLSGVGWSPDGRWLAAGRPSFPGVPVWDAGAVPADRGFWLGGRQANTSYLSTSWAPDGRRLAVCAANLGTQLFDPVTGDRSAKVPGVEFAWTRDGQRTAAVYGETVFVRDGDAKAVLASEELPGQPKRLAWSPTDDRLAVRTADRVWVWEPGAGRPTCVFGTPTKGIDFTPGGGLAWHPAGDRLAFAVPAGDGWRLHVFDPSARKSIRDWPVPMPWAVGWSPDGRTLATAGADGAVRLFDPETGAERTALTGHAGAVHGLAWHPSGGRLATAGADGTVKVWNPATGKPAVTFEMGEAVRGVAWTADGRGLAAGSESGAARVWHVGGG